MLETNATTTLAGVLDRLGAALTSGDIELAVGLFEDDCYWRDLVTFTWNITTMEGRAQVRDMLTNQLAVTNPSDWSLAEGEDVTATDGLIEGWIRFDTTVARGFGYIRLRNGRIWTLLTTMAELKGHEEPQDSRGRWAPSMASRPGARPGKKNANKRSAEPGYYAQPYCVIVGGGQGGIALGARLRQLNVPTIIIDKNDGPATPGASATSRSACTIRSGTTTCLICRFPDNWPVFSPKDKIGDWLEMYTKVMELNYWSVDRSARARSYDEAQRRMAVVVDRDGETMTLRPKQLVLATGMSGKPNVPAFPGMDVFKGEQHHSSPPSRPRRLSPARRCVVIGSNNSAHDICAALWEAGADVTMVQRSSTHVVKSDSLMELALGRALFRARGRGRA